jgi:two-component sensor histidine kinase
MMQAYQLNDPQAQRELLGLRSRIYALGLVHEQLMGSEDLKTFDVAPFLDELSQNIVEGGSQGNVTIKVDACPLQVGLDFAIPLGLLVTELVGNSLKHAFPDGDGNINVSLQTDGRYNLTLIVSDDGRPSLDPDATQPAKPGLGMSIMKGLVAQLEGTMIVRTESGTTTEIRTRMPVQP